MTQARATGRPGDPVAQSTGPEPEEPIVLTDHHDDDPRALPDNALANAWGDAFGCDRPNLDPETGVATRVAFFDHVRAMASDGAQRRSVAAIFVELLDFDPAEDEATAGTLREVALRLHACLRSGDLVARLAGSTFAIVLDDVSYDDARIVAQRLEALLAVPFPLAEAARVIASSVAIAYAADSTFGGELLAATAEATSRSRESELSLIDTISPEPIVLSDLDAAGHDARSPEPSTQQARQ